MIKLNSRIQGKALTTVANFDAINSFHKICTISLNIHNKMLTSAVLLLMDFISQYLNLFDSYQGLNNLFWIIAAGTCLPQTLVHLMIPQSIALNCLKFMKTSTCDHNKINTQSTPTHMYIIARIYPICSYGKCTSTDYIVDKLKL
uniref:Uncharacterized protein n=1 Tax=Glossina austeni TaxID=7395 RepID=A0A1A9VD24_GLOAU